MPFASPVPPRLPSEPPARPGGVTDLGRLRMLSRIVEQVGEGVAVVDNEAHFVYANAEFARMHGCTGEDLETQKLRGSNFYTAEEWGGPVQRLMADALETGIGRAEVTRRRVDGSTFMAHVTLSLLHDDAGELVGRVLCVRDVTEQCEAKALLRTNERRLADAQEIARLGSWEWDLRAGRLTWSHQLFRLAARPLDWQPSYQGFLRQVHPADRPRVEDAVRASLDTGDVFDVTYRMDVAGAERVFHARGDVVGGEDGRPALIRGTAQDVTEAKRTEASLREANARLEHLATTDLLTGLPNRALFHDRLEQAMALARRSGRNVALLFVDVDRFKTVNDSLGHHGGDQVLVEVGRRLAAAVRESDTVARLGGDEFAVLLGGCTPEEAAGAAERVLEALRPGFSVGGVEFFVGASVGVALWPEDCTWQSELLQHADVAMYRAKAAGGNRFEMFQPAMTVAARERLGLESALRRAVEGDEFLLRYHPQIELATGRVTGVEALLRWEPPAGGEVAPDRFIPLAEETALIVPIGAWVLGEACRQAARWRDELDRPLAMAVNVSPRQLVHPGFVKLVADTLAESGLDPALLELEITETILIADAGPATSVLRALRRLGVRLAIDDFGTGYSSLSSLRRAPFDRLKLDMSLIAGLGKGDDSARQGDAALVAAAINLAHAIGVEVVAEGVVDHRQRRALQRFGCEHAQGYLWAEPLLAADVPGWLASR